MDHSRDATGGNARMPRKGDALRPHLSSLRRPDLDAPDLTRSILAEVGKHRDWLDSRERRMITLGRLAGVAAAIAVVAGMFFLQRETKIEEIATGPQARPIGQLVQSVSDQAQRVDVRAALDSGASLTRVVFAQPLALVVNDAESSRGSGSVWSVQWLSMPVMMGSQAAQVSGSEMAIAGFAGMGAGGQDVLPRSLMARSPRVDAASWSSTIVVPAGFEIDRTIPGRANELPEPRRDR